MRAVRRVRAGSHTYRGTAFGIASAFPPLIIGPTTFSVRKRRRATATATATAHRGASVPLTAWPAAGRACRRPACPAHRTKRMVIRTPRCCCPAAGNRPGPPGGDQIPFQKHFMTWRGPAKGTRQSGARLFVQGSPCSLIRRTPLDIRPLVVLMRAAREYFWLALCEITPRLVHQKNLEFFRSRRP
jgi:hypothetical protein